MTPRWKLLAATLFVTLVCFAQSTDLMLTGGTENGRFWRAQSLEGKVSWLFGYHSGLLEAALVSATYNNPDAASPTLAADGTKLQAQITRISIPSGLTYTEIAKALDRVYDTPENLPIDVPDALRIVLMKATGVSPSKIEEQTSQYRKSAAQERQP